MENRQLSKINESEIGTAAFLDVETTGLSPYENEIIELAIVLFKFNRKTGEIIEIIEEYSGLRQPSKPIPIAATRVHGITDAMVKGKYLELNLINSLIDQAEFLLAHNASFDKGFVCLQFPSAISKQWTCSMNGINWRRIGFASKGLQNLLRAHNIKVDQAHRALSDVRASLLLLSQKDLNDEFYFKELLRNQKRQETAAIKKLES